jgi:hypothetical protein
MKRAAIGVQMHSGWGVLVSVSEEPLEILGRQRFVTADPEMRGAIQPYHFATGLKSPDQEKHLAQCAAASSRLAAAAIAEVVKELSGRDYRVAGAAVLSASGRPLPALAVILAAHPLIHTAEGEFFRHAVCTACEGLRIPVTRIRERELDAWAQAAFGSAASQVQSKIAGFGRSIGPPWTKDHKAATLAAALVLARKQAVG